MGGWIYKQSGNVEKLIRHENARSLSESSGPLMPDGEILWKTDKKTSIPLSQTSFWTRWILPVSLLLPVIVAGILTQSKPSNETPISTSPKPIEKGATLLAEGSLETNSSPSPSPTPVIHLKEVTKPPSKVDSESASPLPASKQEALKAKIKPSKRKSRPRARASKSTKWKKAEVEARKAFTRGDFDRASKILDLVAKKESGNLPEHLQPIEAEIAYAKCHQAFRQKKWKEALRQCEIATSLRKHPRAEAILEDLGAKSEKFYLEAYVMEGTNRTAALRRYREAFAMAPSGHPYRKKARMKLKSFDSLAVR